MKKCLLMAMLIVLFMTTASLAWGQSIFWQDTFDTNNGWTLEPNWAISGGQLTLGWSPSVTNFNMTATSPIILVPASAGDLVISQYLDEYTGQGNPVETYKISVVANGVTTDLWTYAEDADWGVTGGENLTVSLAPYAGQSIQLKFNATGETTFNFNYWYIYEMTAYANLAVDMGALSLTGSTTPTQGTATNYVVTVKNNGQSAVSAYTVKLMKDATTEIGSQAGTTLAVGATQTHAFSWTPAAAGPAVLTGKVIVTGDLNPNNDVTAPLNITVQPTGIQAVTIGSGDQMARKPLDFYWKNSLFETLYMSDEIGFVSGTVTSMALFNSFTSNLPATPVKIWLGSTNLMDLSTGWIPSGQLTLVYDGMVNFPSGANTIMIPFQTPYMHTPGNLVMMVQRPMDASYYSSSDNFLCQTVGTNRTLSMQSDSAPYDPAAPVAGTLSGQFPKTTFFYSGQAIVNDMSCMNVTGNSTPSVGSASTYTVSVKNNGTAVQNNYMVKLFKQGDVEVGSVNGTAITSLQTLQFSIPWTPTAIGPTFLYGKVVLTGDEIATNNQTANLNVVVQAAGIVARTVGAGGSTGRMPLDMFYKSSLFETVYLASELNIGGLLTGVQFYNSFSTNITASPTKIWIGETTQTDLSAGWIPSTELTQVFDGNVDYPNGPNNILITLTTPYPYGGGNMVVMVQRPLDAAYYSSSDVFVTQSGTVTGRTRNLYSDSINYDPTAPPTATAVAIFPKATFMFIVDGMGSLSGTVNGPGNTPLAGATVTVANTSLTYTTGATGTYSFPYISEGAQVVSATKHGYTVVTNNVTIVEDQAAVSNFTIALLPQVTVSGKVVGSDQPTVGLAGATVNLTGYEPYTATTIADGTFSIPNVFASQTYNYTVIYAGYTNATGQAVVGTTNLAMGNITVNEIALPATQVVAAEAANFSNVVVTWGEPGTAGGEWLSYCGIKDDSIGTGAAADFDVAIRYPASALTDYAGMSLYSVKVWPAQAGSFSLRVWTGGTATAPGAMVVDQAFTPVLDQYNEITLTTPVLIPAGQELWFGYRCNVTEGYPAGCDAGPQTEGLGNMMYFQGVWQTLFQLAPTLTYNWNIEGYVGYSAPTRGGAELVPLAFNANRFNTGTLGTSGIKTNTATNSKPQANDRVRTGYKVWRLLAADQATEANWTLLTPSAITALTYTDNTWQPLVSGVYKYAVKTVYTNNVLAAAAFSNSIHKGMMGTLTGTVTDVGNGSTIAGAIVTAGDYTGTSNASGVYSFGVYQGVYTVNCAKPGYQAASQPAVTVTGMQTTTQNFALAEIALPPSQVVSEIVQNNTIVNLSWMPPDPNSASISEDFEGPAFPPEDWSQIITNTAPANTTGVYPTWCTAGTLAIDPPIIPHSGALQAGLWWEFAHQDEWLITPQFGCPPAASLNFWGSVFFGSVNGDHYYVKVSTDNGATWTVLWDASTLTGGWNYYVTPISIDLAAYAGQQIKLAWQAIDGDGQGLWYVWFIDDIAIGNATTTLTFAGHELTSISAAAPRTVDGTSNIPAVASRAALNKSDRNVVEPVIESNYSYTPSRALTGYKAWRLLQGQETNEAIWTSLTPNTITATGLQDTGWAGVPDGTYKWAVKAVYTGNVMSMAGFSNPQTKLTQVGTIAGLVRNPSNQGIAGATVTCGTTTATTNASGAYSMTVGAGTVSVTASANGYTAVTQTGIVVVTGQTTTVNFQLPVSQILLSDGFETYPNFALTFAPWTLVDVDMATTYGMTGVAWENAYAAMAYIIFNPSATVPPVTTLPAQEGSKMAASFAATVAPNNDWLITPQVAGGGDIRFYARSMTAQYGLERFKVGVSTTGTNPTNFTIISGTTHIEAPIDWTEYTYNLAAYAGQQIYVGIQCVSNDAFVFAVDNVRMNGSAGDDPIAPVIATQLYGNYPNPFNPETTIRYSVKDASPVTIGIYNLKGQLVKTLVSDTKAAGNYNVVWNGTDNNGSAVSSGVYYYKMYAGKFSSTRKMILMK